MVVVAEVVVEVDVVVDVDVEPLLVYLARSMHASTRTTRAQSLFSENKLMAFEIVCSSTNESRSSLLSVFLFLDEGDV